jgi:hypothetical protein
MSCACGLLSWNELILQMKAKLRSNCFKADLSDLNQFLKDNGPMEIAGLFKRQVGSAEYARFLRERFRNQSWSVAPILKAVVRLPARVIFTTNFDKLIETACRNRIGEDPVVIIRPQQLSSLDGNERRIVKIHGDIDHPETIVLTDQDYSEFPQKCMSMRTYFQGQMAFSTLLLVGFGLRDANFASIYAAAKDLVSDSQPRVIALMAKQNAFETEKWRQLGLIINSFDAYDDITKFLQAIRRGC